MQRIKTPLFLICSALTTGILFFGCGPRNDNKSNEPKIQKTSRFDKIIKVHGQDKFVPINAYKRYDSYYQKAVSRLTITKSINELRPSVSHSSKKVLFEGWYGDTDQMGIFMVDSNTGKKRELVYKDSHINFSPTFGHKDESIFFASSRNGSGFFKSNPIFWIKKNGLGGLHLVPKEEANNVTSLDISIDGSIAYSYYSNQNPEDSVINIINKENKYTLKVINGREVHWSPDGQKLIFTAITHNEKRDIFMINRDGSNLIQITNFNEDVSSPTFSPDGKWICFSGRHNQLSASKGDPINLNWDIYSCTSYGEDLTQLTIDPAPDKTPFWAADQYIYFSSSRFGNYELMKVQAFTPQESTQAK